MQLGIEDFLVTYEFARWNKDETYGKISSDGLIKNEYLTPFLMTCLPERRVKNATEITLVI